MKCLVLIFSIIFGFSTNALAQTSSRWSSGYDFTQRAADREKGRWSLTDWLAMKERNRQMDMWLSMNSPSPFEFMLGASQSSYKTESGGIELLDSTRYSLEASAYAQLVGLGAEYDQDFSENEKDMAGLFNIRIFGNSIQNSSLVLSYGWRKRIFTDSLSADLEQQFAQASLQLYITKYFGIDGKYRYFFPASNDEVEEVKGDLVQAGAFLDFNMLRVFGAWYQEKLKYQTPGGGTSEDELKRTGVKIGLKLFF